MPPPKKLDEEMRHAVLLRREGRIGTDVFALVNRSTGAHIAYSNGMPSAVLLAGPQKQTTIVSSGAMGLNRDLDQV